VPQHSANLRLIGYEKFTISALFLRALEDEIRVSQWARNGIRRSPEAPTESHDLTMRSRHLSGESAVPPICTAVDSWLVPIRPAESALEKRASGNAGTAHQDVGAFYRETGDGTVSGLVLDSLGLPL
jgi:hypothetical protein